MNTAAATTQASAQAEAAGADALAEHFATATPAELMQTMLSLGTRFFQASEAFDKAMQRRHQLAAQQAAEVLMPDPAPAPPAPPTQPAQPPGSTGELINLGEVSRRLGLPMVTEKYLAQLGFEPDQRSKSARLYPAGSVPSMARAISAQLQATATANQTTTTATP